MELETNLKTVDSIADVPPGHGLFEIMDHTGDTKKIWDPNNADEVADARRSYNDLKKKGYAAFRVGSDGEAGELMRDFDPQAGRIIMRPPMQGG